jgi:hypothetical protein
MRVTQHRMLKVALALGARVAVAAGLLVAESSFAAGPVVPPAEAVLAGGAPAARTLRYTEVAPGLLARSLFATTKAGPVAVEIVDLLVGPGQSVRLPAAQFAGLLAIEAGAPLLSVDGKSAAIEPGRLLGIDQGRSLTIDNRREKRAVFARLIKLQAQGN